MAKHDRIFILEAFNSMTGIEDSFIVGVYDSKSAALKAFSEIKEKYRNNYISEWSIK